MVDQEFGHIIGWTPLDEAHANVEKLSNEKEVELQAAFQARRLQYDHVMP